MSRLDSEEIANSVTHAIGVGLAIAGLVLLVIFAAGSRDAWRIVSVSIYGTTLVLLYTASTLYHSFQNPRVKKWFRVLDHSCIYLLIAGTYTPFTLVSLRGTWGWWLFGITWALAIGGLLFKLIFVDRFHFVSVVLYLIMGWLAVFAMKPILNAVPLTSILWLAGGGLLYTIGVVFYANDRKLRFGHAIWHLFVLGGSVCHFIAVFLTIILTATASRN